MENIRKNQSGYIALIAVLIIMVVSLAIGLSLNMLSIGETQAGLSVQQSSQSFYVANSCMQEAYLRLKRDSNYAGDNLNIGQESCNITVTGGLNNRIINVESDVNGVIRKLESEVQLGIIGSGLRVRTWQELN